MREKMEHQVQIYLDIMDFDRPLQEITNLLGIEPTSAHAKGTLNPKGVMYRRSVWSLRSKANTSEADIEEHWESIKDIVTKREDLIKSLGQECLIKMTIVVRAEDRFPSIIIPPSMSLFAGHVGASVDIDVFE